jgi:hypothetical protein
MLDAKKIAAIKNTILYNPVQGTFIRRDSKKPAYLKPNKNSSPRILVEGKEYAAKSLACLLMLGIYPNKYDVKSLDGNKDNLIWDNLYLVKTGYKFCTKCNKEKPIAEYTYRDSKKKVRRAECKECVKSIYASQARKYNLKQFGLTVEQYEEIYTTQNKGCAICGGVDKNKRLAVDHCHTTGRVRGLLCAQCNQGLGLFKDSPEVLNKAAAYLGT